MVSVDACMCGKSLKQMKSQTRIDVTPKTMVQKYDHYKHFMDEFRSQVLGQTQFEIRSCERVMWNKMNQIVASQNA